MIDDSDTLTRPFERKFFPFAFKGGTDTGPNPKEYMLASLAACTSITIRIYAGM